jgi:acyl carrier protein
MVKAAAAFSTLRATRELYFLGGSKIEGGSQRFTSGAVWHRSRNICSTALPKIAANLDFRNSYQGGVDDVVPWDMPKHGITARGHRDGLMGDDTFNQIQSIIAADLEIAPSKVVLSTSFVDDLHANSLDMIELIMAFEEAFDVMIPDIAMGTIVTVQDAVDYIKQQQKPRRSDVPGS